MDRFQEKAQELAASGSEELIAKALKQEFENGLKIAKAGLKSDLGIFLDEYFYDEKTNGIKTQVFESYDDFLARPDKSVNGVDMRFAMENPEYEEDNGSNYGCWNCYDCADCTNCTSCIDCTGCMNCTRCIDCICCVKCTKLVNGYDLIEQIND